MRNVTILLIIVSFQLNFNNCRSECLHFNISLTQKIENEGFHREIRWLLETNIPSLSVLQEHHCSLAICLNVPREMCANPDEMAEQNRIGKLHTYLDRFVNVESVAHLSDEHALYIYVPENNGAISFHVPIHLRYQRAQIAGTFGKVLLKKPTILGRCLTQEICSKVEELRAPCIFEMSEKCSWKNVTYQALFDDVELLVPVGDLDHYPLVAIVTLLLGCAACIYILSILSTTKL